MLVVQPLYFVAGFWHKSAYSQYALLSFFSNTLILIGNCNIGLIIFVRCVVIQSSIFSMSGAVFNMLVVGCFRLTASVFCKPQWISWCQCRVHDNQVARPSHNSITWHRIEQSCMYWIEFIVVWSEIKFNGMKPGPSRLTSRVLPVQCTVIVNCCLFCVWSFLLIGKLV